MPFFRAEKHLLLRDLQTELECCTGYHYCIYTVPGYGTLVCVHSTAHGWGQLMIREIFSSHVVCLMMQNNDVALFCRSVTTVL
jgi:hypothetical protein